MKKKKLGEVLRERGHISSGDLAQAVAEQEGKLTHLGELLLERGLVEKRDVASALEEITHVPYVDCSTISPDAATLRLIPLNLAMRCCVFPVSKPGSDLVVVMAAPQNIGISDEIRFHAGMNVSPRLGFRNEILAAIEKHYEGADSAAGAAAGFTAEPAKDELVPEMEFVSTSTRQANQEAMLEVQAELLHKRTPP